VLRCCLFTIWFYALFFCLQIWYYRPTLSGQSGKLSNSVPATSRMRWLFTFVGVLSRDDVFALRTVVRFLPCCSLVCAACSYAATCSIFLGNRFCPAHVIVFQRRPAGVDTGLNKSKSCLIASTRALVSQRVEQPAVCRLHHVTRFANADVPEAAATTLRVNLQEIEPSLFERKHDCAAMTSRVGILFNRFIVYSRECVKADAVCHRRIICYLLLDTFIVCVVNLMLHRLVTSTRPSSPEGGGQFQNRTRLCEWWGSNQNRRQKVFNRGVCVYAGGGGGSLTFWNLTKTLIIKVFHILIWGSLELCFVGKPSKAPRVGGTGSNSGRATECFPWATKCQDPKINTLPAPKWFFKRF